MRTHRALPASNHTKALSVDLINLYFCSGTLKTWPLASYIFTTSLRHIISIEVSSKTSYKEEHFSNRFYSPLYASFINITQRTKQKREGLGSKGTTPFAQCTLQVSWQFHFCCNALASPQSFGCPEYHDGQHRGCCEERETTAPSPASASKHWEVYTGHKALLDSSHELMVTTTLSFTVFTVCEYQEQVSPFFYYQN